MKIKFPKTNPIIKDIFVLSLLFIVFLILAVAINSLFVYLLWNLVIAPVFHLPELNIVQIIIIGFILGAVQSGIKMRREK